MAPGSNINSCPDAETISLQEGDIPALMQVELDGLHFELSVLNGIVVGIRCDFEYEPDKLFPIGFAENTLQLGYNTTAAALQAWLNIEGIAYTIEEDNNNINVYIERSAAHLIFGDGNQLYKAILFDMDLYESLCKTF